MAGATAMEDAWIRALLGQDGYLTGDDARTAACDAVTVPAVTGTMDLSVIDLVSGPAGVAAILRQGLLEPPWNTPSLPLDIGWSDSIPAWIRKAVILRDKHCAWPKCHRPAAWCDVHHIVHKKDGGEASVRNCVLLCQFHHDVCIHRRDWRIILHPDGTTSVYGPRGQVRHSHSPPAARAG
jgi:HNH endonuclease